ncbi:unnamed protein product [Fraxinus pennsylvanica]|uniref:Uncharacterized protein n=1 Tax=Fraxinus pennsylvanica TaxID=56036 RepID=A0AAD1ZQP7_9LAMI|nr:unnamed protein product [Fraxinus pennsylvanica]
MDGRRPGSHSDFPPPIADLRLKILQIVSGHEQLKMAFNQLNSQIKDSLRETEDVFTSLALPLMKLVGLKTVEMAEEGRFSTIITDTNRSHSQGCWSGSGIEELIRSVSAIKKWDNCANNMESFHKPRLGLSNTTYNGMEQSGKKTQEESYTDRATTAGKELREKQKLQLMQLIHLLKQIEIQVNSSKNDILETLYVHQVSLKRFFHKAFTHVSAIHQSSRDNGMSLMMLTLLKASFDHVGAAVSSVEVGVDNLIRDLAEKMCNPMVEYVHALKGEFTTGTCTRLLTVVEEMDGAMRVRRLELQEARNRAVLAEKSRLELLRKLKESEEMVKKLKTHDIFLLEANRKPKENLIQQKCPKPLTVVEDQAKDDKLIWELLRNKRKHQMPDSPSGPKQLLGIGANDKNLKSTSTISSISCMVTRRQTKGRSRLLLGSSPSAHTQKVLSRKRVTP